MTWTPMSSRLSGLPILLAGPIVRRCEASSVTVWLVLKEDRTVILDVYDSSAGSGVVMSGVVGQGVALGEHVYVYCITASGATLNAGRNYYYDIDLGSGSSLSALIRDGLDLTFDGGFRPSFSLPPDNLDSVRLAHGSCRKPHGEGLDALEGVYEMMLTAVSGSSISADNRPHQLFLTGDQIYADDVSDMLLFMINDAATTLFNWDENYSPFTQAELAPGKRNTNNRLRNAVGFTGMLPDKPQYSKSHLLKFREYALMYIFAWSDVLWPSLSSDMPDFTNVNWLLNTNLPSFQTVFPDDEYRVIRPTSQQTCFSEESAHVYRFATIINKIRKLFANIPTYMLFDDHEVTDDWNLNWRWCKEVYSKELGRRTVQNGLLAYAIFQAWGNDPEQFEQPTKDRLLSAAENWRGPEDANFNRIKELLNIPTISSTAPIENFPHHAGTYFDWNFLIRFNNYNILALDSRTWRGYPSGSGRGSDLSFATLISSSGFSRQLPSTLPDSEINLVICPCPVIGVPFIEEHQRSRTTWEDRCDVDTEAWSLNAYGFYGILGNLASRVPVVGSGAASRRNGRFILLSGDVHYGLSARCQMWGRRFINESTYGANSISIFAQLTASSCKNQTEGATGTITLHTDGYPHSAAGAIFDYITNSVQALPEPEETFSWLVEPSSAAVGQFRHRSGLWPYGPVSRGMLTRTPERLQHDHVETLSVEPSWRTRIDWMLAENTGHESRIAIHPSRVAVPPSVADRANALRDYLRMAHEHGEDYMGRWGDGKEIVGYNNVGEIRFELSGTRKQVKHVLWWRMNPRIGDTPLQVFPLTTYTIPVNESGDTTHTGDVITQPTYTGL